MMHSLKRCVRRVLSQFSLLTLVLVGFLVMMSVAIGSVQTTSDAEKKQALEDAIMRSALHCYSLEGAYPSDIAYLEEHYNLAVNWDTYIVHYETFASNIAPDITVIVREEGAST